MTAGGQPSCHPLSHFAASQLTRKPRVVHDLTSRDPDELKGRPESGRLLAELCIEADGQVSRVNVIESDLPEVFSEVMVRNFGQVRFAPGEIDGRAVRSTSRIEVRIAPLSPALPASAVVERVPLAEDPPLRPAPTAAGN